MTNLTHISFLCIYFNSVHVSSNPVLIIRRINCINTTSGICHCVSLTVSCAGRKGTFRPVHETVRNFPTCTRNGHRDRVTYLYTRYCIDSWCSWWWARGCSKHVENWYKYIEKNCASSWSFTKNHNKMHDQQNIKKEPHTFKEMFIIAVLWTNDYHYSGTYETYSTRIHFQEPLQ